MGDLCAFGLFRLKYHSAFFADSLMGRFSDFQIQNMFWKYADDHLTFVINVI